MKKIYLLLITFLAFQLNAQYSVESINFESISLNDSEFISLNSDDMFSEAIQFPFEFDFFGEDYYEVTIGSNGLVSFEIDNASGYCPWQIEDLLPDNEDTSRFNAIMLLNDMNPRAENATDNTGVYFRNSGTEPNRVFSIIFNEIPQFGGGCESNYTTFEVKLFEETNVIEMHVLNKPECPSWNDGNSAIAIQNNDGTVAFVPENRNVGLWSTEGEAWRFTPTEEEEDYHYVDLSACSENGVYPTIDLYDFVLGLPDNLNYTFHLTPELDEFGEFIQNPTYYSFESLPTTIYFSLPTETGYTTMGQIDIDDDGECEEEFDEIEYELCYAEDGLPIIDLTYIWSQVADVVDFVDDSFHLTSQEALNNENPIMDLTNFQMTEDPQSVYVRRYNEDNELISYIELEISLEDCNEPNEAEYEYCWEEGDDFPALNLYEVFASVYDVTDQNYILFYSTMEDAENQSNPIGTASYYQVTEEEEDFYVTITGTDSDEFIIVEFEVSAEDCDADNDGVSDENEDLNGDGDYDNDDTDNDGTPNYMDDDDDGDSVPTETEVDDDAESRYAYRDTDGDGIENYLDNDDDGDGVLTIDEDWNENGTPLDDDLNNNGIPDFLDDTISSLSLHDISFAQEVKFYPNPVKEVLYIDSDVSEMSDLQIFNAQGKLMMNVKAENAVSVEKLPVGVYIISGTYKGKAFSKKLIKQ